MLTESESKRYFLLGCIPTRVFIIYLTYLIINKYNKNNNYNLFLTLLLIIIGISFIYLYLTNSRLNAFEAGGKTYWANYRIIHGFLYIVAGAMAYNKNKNAYIPLIIDLIMGILIFLNYRIK